MLTEYRKKAIGNAAYLIDANWNLLCYNTAFESLFGKGEDIAPQNRNIIWMMFFDERFKSAFKDWEQTAKDYAKGGNVSEFNT